MSPQHTATASGVRAACAAISSGIDPPGTSPRCRSSRPGPAPVRRAEHLDLPRPDPGVGGHRRQHPAQPARRSPPRSPHRTNPPRRSVARAAHPAAGITDLAQVHAQVEPGGRGADRDDGRPARRASPRTGERRSAARASPGTAGGGPGSAPRRQLLDQLLERHVLVRVGAQRRPARPGRAACGTAGLRTDRRAAPAC